MTKDQIRTIASELAEQISPSLNPVGWISAYKQCFIVLNALSTRYCIVEREKAMKEYDTIKHLKERDYSYEDVLNLLVYLFGTSMFNQNEE